MSLADQIQSDVDGVLLDDFAESIAGTPAGGTSAPLRAVVSRGLLNVRPTDRGKSLGYELEIVVSITDWPALTINADFFQVAGRVGATPGNYRASHDLTPPHWRWMRKIGLSKA